MEKNVLSRDKKMFEKKNQSTAEIPISVAGIPLKLSGIKNRLDDFYCVPSLDFVIFHVILNLFVK